MQLTGLVLLITGIVILLANTEYEDLITRRFFAMPNFVIVTGVIILLASILGFYAAISEQFYFVAGVRLFKLSKQTSQFSKVFL